MPDLQPAVIIDTPAEGVSRLRLNRPERRNALSTPVLQKIAASLHQLEEVPGCRVVLITGSESVFAAGADINELAQSGPDDPVESPRFQAWQAIREFPKPIVAAVEGWCLGAGAELMLCADIVIASKAARIGLPETNLGIMPGAGGTAILPRLIGLPRAMDMVLTGGTITGSEAWSLGLVARQVEPGQAGPEGLALAASLATRAPLALQAAKASLRMACRLSLPEHLKYERKAFLDLLGTADKTEGMRAFLEKRPANWSGS